MLELARDLIPLLRAGVGIAAVSVTAVTRSAPRGIGASMAVTADGRVIGSISGGCVEGDAVMLAHQARLTGRTQRAQLGFSDDSAHAAGLACGGSVDVAAYPVRATAEVLGALEAVVAGRGTTAGVVLSGPSAGAVVAEPMLRRTVHAELLGPPLALRESAVLFGAYGGADLLLISAAPPARLLLLGAGEHAAALCRVAAAAGFAVEVCDVWPALVTRERFPDAVRLAAELPRDYLAALDVADLDARTAICVLTHDERVDVPALELALALPVGFVGAMGARATVAHRTALLRDRGVPAADLARLHSPIGLDLGASTPAETAIAVLAEILASRYGGSGAPLRDRGGPLHERSPVAVRHAQDLEPAAGWCSPSSRPLAASSAGAP